MPLAYTNPMGDPIVFNEDCSIRTTSKNSQQLGENIGNKGGRFYGYDTNYICMLKRVKEFAEFIKVSDPEAIVIFQSDHGIFQGDIMYQKIFTLVKTSEECKRHLSSQIDNINAIRLMMSCATNQEVKLVKKKSFNFIDGKLFLIN